MCRKACRFDSCPGHGDPRQRTLTGIFYVLSPASAPDGCEAAHTPSHRRTGCFARDKKRPGTYMPGPPDDVGAIGNAPPADVSHAPETAPPRQAARPDRQHPGKIRPGVRDRPAPKPDRRSAGASERDAFSGHPDRVRHRRRRSDGASPSSLRNGPRGPFFAPDARTRPAHRWPRPHRSGCRPTRPDCPIRGHPAVPGL